MAAPSMAPTPTTSPPSPAASPAMASIHDGPLAAGTYRMGQWDTDCQRASQVAAHRLRMTPSA